MISGCHIDPEKQFWKQERAKHTLTHKLQQSTAVYYVSNNLQPWTQPVFMPFYIQGEAECLPDKQTNISNQLLFYSDFFFLFIFR